MRKDGTRSTVAKCDCEDGGMTATWLQAWQAQFWSQSAHDMDGAQGRDQEPSGRGGKDRWWGNKGAWLVRRTANKTEMERQDVSA